MPSNVCPQIVLVVASLVAFPAVILAGLIAPNSYPFQEASQEVELCPAFEYVTLIADPLFES